MWRRSLDFGVIEEVRQISARIRDHFAQGAEMGPGFDLKRGRGGIREVEFFVQIQQMIHGGRDPSVRAAATLDAIEALLAAGRTRRVMAGELCQSYRLLRTIEHRVQMVDDAQTHLLPRELGGARQCRAAARTCDAAKNCLPCLAVTSKRSGRIFDSLAPDERDVLSNDPDILSGRAGSARLRRSGAALRGMYRHWRSGKAAVAPLSGRASGV